MDIKRHHQIRWTIHRNELCPGNYIRKCARIRSRSRRFYESKTCSFRWSVWPILSIKHFFTNISVTSNLVIWSIKLLKMMNFAKPFVAPTHSTVKGGHYSFTTNLSSLFLCPLMLTLSLIESLGLFFPNIDRFLPSKPRNHIAHPFTIESLNFCIRFRFFPLTAPWTLFLRRSCD